MARSSLARPLFVVLFGLVGCANEATTPAPASDVAVAPTPTGASANAPAARVEGTAEVGKSAPDFTLTDVDGKTVRLADFKGKTVVLEWFNPECPFVKLAHGKGSLKTMAAEQTQKGVVWLGINSAAPGKQGHGREVNVKGKEGFGLSHPILLDETGVVGKAYGATNTPHMFVIDPQGVLVYAGGLDDTGGGEPESGDVVKNYVALALGAVASNQQVAESRSKAWGCSVKYGN